MPQTETAESFSKPLAAKLFLRMSERSEEAGQAETRKRLLAQLSGRVIELGAGHGLNLPHYPTTVTDVLAVEPEESLRTQAEKAARAAPVRVVAGGADALPARDDEFDAAVCSLVLCSVPDQGRALAELLRVVRPGGELRFYEHVRSRRPGFARFQDAVNVVWSRVGGCNLNRDTPAAISAAGFRIESLERFPFQPSLVHAPARPHVLGLARRP